MGVGFTLTTDRYAGCSNSHSHHAGKQEISFPCFSNRLVRGPYAKWCEGDKEWQFCYSLPYSIGPTRLSPPSPELNPPEPLPVPRGEEASGTVNHRLWVINRLVRSGSGEESGTVSHRAVDLECNEVKDQGPDPLIRAFLWVSGMARPGHPEVAIRHRRG